MIFAAIWDSDNESWDSLLQLHGDTLQIFKEWLVCMSQQGVSLFPKPPQGILLSDASLDGYGAILRYRQGLPPRRFQGRFGREKGQHINLLEVWAALWAIREWSAVLPDELVLYLDNIAAMYAFRTCYVRNHPEATRQLQRMALHLWQTGKRISGVFYVPTHSNVEADQLSRVVNFKYDWQLLPVIFKEFIDFITRNGYPVPTVDRFASAKNALLPQYNSLYDDVGSSGNFWKCDPSEQVSWVNPPWNLFQEVINFFQRQPCTAWILAPCWNKKQWFPFFQQKAVFAYHLTRDRKRTLFRPEHPELMRGEVKPPGYPCVIYLCRFPC